jgi:hypothetical protein
MHHPLEITVFPWPLGRNINSKYISEGADENIETKLGGCDMRTENTAGRRFSY